MADDWKRFTITTVLTLGAAVVGLVQFGQSYSLSVRQPFLIKQMDQCVAASESVARLASTRDAATWRAAREQFWMLYLGPLAIVENVDPRGKTGVAAAMVAFGQELNKIKGTAPELPLPELEGKALAVSHACRDLLIARWKSGPFGWLMPD